jgi:hypothetical protein
MPQIGMMTCLVSTLYWPLVECSACEQQVAPEHSLLAIVGILFRDTEIRAIRAICMASFGMRAPKASEPKP